MILTLSLIFSVDVSCFICHEEIYSELEEETASSGLKMNKLT